MQGEQAMVGTAAAVWSSSPQRAAMAIDRLMALRLVTGASIVAWAFGELRVKRFEDEFGAGLAWEALYAAVNKTLARTQVRGCTRHCRLIWRRLLSSSCKELWRAGLAQSGLLICADTCTVTCFDISPAGRAGRRGDGHGGGAGDESGTDGGGGGGGGGAAAGRPRRRGRRAGGAKSSFLQPHCLP